MDEKPIKLPYDWDRDSWEDPGNRYPVREPNESPVNEPSEIDSDETSYNPGKESKTLCKDFLRTPEFILQSFKLPYITIAICKQNLCMH